MEKIRILLTDRNRHVRELLRRELADEGYEVAVARDAQEILGLLARGEIPDLLILDVEIPYMTEANLLQSLKENYAALPVIIHSFQPENPREVIAADAAAFLEKTENPQPLKSAIAALIHK